MLLQKKIYNLKFYLSHSFIKWIYLLCCVLIFLLRDKYKNANGSVLISTIGQANQPLDTYHPPCSVSGEVLLSPAVLTPRSCYPGRLRCPSCPIHRPNGSQDPAVCKKWGGERLYFVFYFTKIYCLLLIFLAQALLPESPLKTIKII